MKHNLLLELKKGCKTYNKKGHACYAVKNVNLTLKRGESIGIVGESGCGKSTLAKMLAHLTPVTSGTILFKGEDVTGLSRKNLKEYYKKIQIIFQDPLGAFSPRMKIGSFLIEPFINFKIKNRKAAQKHIDEILSLVGLDISCADKYAGELSGGQLQRIVIARAIALSPEIIICDECTASLDVIIQNRIITLLKKIQKKHKFSTIFITHDLALAENFCDRVYVMYNGRIVEETESKNLSLSMKHDYSKKLIESVNFFS